MTRCVPRRDEASPESVHPLVLAVTGTDGKTSTVWLTRQLIEICGRRAFGFSTFGILVPGGAIEAARSFPGRAGTDFLMGEMANRGADYVVWEAFSSALGSGVLDELKPQAAALTNLTRDHLDGHRSYAHYRSSKERLFIDLLRPEGIAVLPIDRPEGESLEKTMRAGGRRVLGFGRAARTRVRLIGAWPTPGGSRIEVNVEGRAFHGKVPLIGRPLVDDLLAAVGLALAGGIVPESVIDAISRLKAPPARMELVAEVNGAIVYLDYAHTPAALGAALEALRRRTANRLHVLFGCGGDRDAGKRPLMGHVAHRAADRVIVTDDNPRSEDPARIRAQVLAGCPTATEVPDRKQALVRALGSLHPGDSLLVAGKGHETTQSIGSRNLPFSDREVIGRLLCTQLATHQTFLR